MTRGVYLSVAFVVANKDANDKVVIDSKHICIEKESFGWIDAKILVALNWKLDEITTCNDHVILITN